MMILPESELSCEWQWWYYLRVSSPVSDNDDITWEWALLWVIMSGRAPPANGPDSGSGGTRFMVLAGRGGRLPADNIGIGIYGGEGCRGKRKVVCYPAEGGGQAALLPLPTAPGRLPKGGWVGKRSQRLRGAGRLTRSPPPPPAWQP